MHRLMGWAIAGAIWCCTAPALAQQGDATYSAQSLRMELEVLDDRINEADRLIQRAEAGEFLVPTGMSMIVVSRDRLIEWATQQIYLEGTGIAEVGQAAVGQPLADNQVAGQEEVLRRVRRVVAGTRAVLATLREAREDDALQRAQVQHDLAALAGAAAAANQAAPGAAATVTCSFPHTWQVRMENGSVSLAVDASGNVSGSGITTGRATLVGNQLTLQWFAQAGGGELGGRYIVALDRACNGSGESVLDILPPGASGLGIRGGPVTFTSQSGTGPS